MGPRIFLVTRNTCTLVCLPLCAIHISFSVCAKTVERLFGQCCQEGTKYVSSVSILSASSGPVPRTFVEFSEDV